MRLFRFVLILGILFPVTAEAQTYPSRPVTFLVPWPPGGSTDISMRAIAAIAEKHLGGRIVIENKPGVSGTMGAQALAQGARPDGYTIAQMPITVFRLPQMMKTSYDPTSDFTWIIHVTGYTFGVVVRSARSAGRRCRRSRNWATRSSRTRPMASRDRRAWIPQS
jgi:tripartite-type tricarboxylate transporter receptor subunit TctC